MPVSQGDIAEIRKQFEPLIGVKVNWLTLPKQALTGFEPSQLAVISNTILDAALPQIELLASDPENAEHLSHIKISKSPGSIGQRESYPDYIHQSGKRLELKGLFVDNPDLPLKRPPTAREPSARIKENVRESDVQPDNDILLVVAVRLECNEDNKCYPTIVDLGLFPMIDCVKARDQRLLDAAGRFIDGMPMVISNEGAKKAKAGEALTDLDFEKDTNFGKLKRIPYPPLQEFMKAHGAI